MSACVEWTGTIDKDGYGRRGRHLAHRLVWTQERGPIPQGLVIDHLCFNRACVNVDHLRLVTPVENMRRQRAALATHCRRGHEYTPENLSKNAGRRKCKKCDSLRHKRKVSEPETDSPVVDHVTSAGDLQAALESGSSGSLTSLPEFGAGGGPRQTEAGET